MAERYPDTVVQFGAWFPDDAACLDYLTWLRWGDAGFGCHLCGSVGRGWPRRDGVSWDCGSCGSRTSATAGTIFHHTRTPLTVWFRAGWELTTRANGVSARGIQRTLGLGSYQTAWTMLHRFRYAMVVPGLDGESLRAALRENIELGSVVRSDGLVILGQSMEGFVHQRKSVQGSGTPAHILFPAVSRVQAQIKRSLEGTLQGAAEPEHLQGYLNEFEFRFNRRKAGKPGLLFYRLLEQAVHTAPASYDDIAVGGTRPRKTAPMPPPGPRGLPQSLAQPDAGRPWRAIHR